MKLNLPIHHIGVATRSIDKEIQLFYALGFVQEGEFVDETQGVRGVFVIPAMQTSFESKTPLDSLSQSSAALPQSATTNSPTIPYRFELLENLKNSTRLDTYLKHHQKLYHIAFATRDIQKDCKAILDSLTLESNKSSINLAGGGGGRNEKKCKLWHSYKSSANTAYHRYAKYKHTAHTASKTTFGDPHYECELFCKTMFYYATKSLAYRACRT